VRRQGDNRARYLTLLSAWHGGSQEASLRTSVSPLHPLRWAAAASPLRTTTRPDARRTPGTETRCAGHGRG